MRRYWISNPQYKEDLLIIQGDEFHHIFEVCRFQPEEKFELLGIKEDKAFRAEVVHVGKKYALVKIKEERIIAPLPLPRIILNLSIPRFSTLENICEKSVELGVYRLQLFCSNYSFIRNPKEITDQKINRLKKIITQATQQTGRGHLMVIEDSIINFEHLIKKINLTPSKRGLMAYENLNLQSTLKEIWKEMQSEYTTFGTSKQINSQTIPPFLEEIHLFVGSEGGFSQQEVNLAQSQGIKLVSLGSQVLRVETACIVFIGSIKCLLGHF